MISKEKKNTLHIASCSFGKDSLATILLALEHGEPLDEAVYCEVMFDKRTSGEVPEHRAFIYETALPRLERLGIPVRVLRSDKTYLDLFAGTVTRGPKKGLRRGFPLCGHCYVQRDCKLRPIRRYNNNFSAVVPYDLEQQRKETREMLDDLTTRDQRMMFAVVTLVHLADSKEELDSDTETLQSIARKHLCQLTTLNWQQADGLVTALPLGLRRIDALRTLTTEALAVLMPFKAQEIWDRGGVYYGQNAISKNLIVADRRQLLNGNAFILGVSGSGKSFSAKKEMVSLALSTQDDIIVIDPESEYRPLIEGLGGQVINISATSPNHINAMDMEQGYGDGENPVVLKSEFLLSLCEQLIGAGKLSAKEKSVIDRCTAQVYRDYIRSGYHGAVPTLQDFHAELLRQPEKEAQDVALAIELFTDGSLNTFAKPTNVDTNARILCYDIRDLGKQLLPVGMLVVLDSIFNRIIRNRGLKRNTWIYIDEIYLLFQHEYSANFLFTLWKRMRKYQACGTGISQNIEDLLQSHTARTMLANSEFLIMLNQAATDREELARLLKISDNQLSYITNVDSGRGLIKCGSAIVPFVDHFPKNKLYQMMTTKPSDLAS